MYRVQIRNSICFFLCHCLLTVSVPAGQNNYGVPFVLAETEKDALSPQITLHHPYFRDYFTQNNFSSLDDLTRYVRQQPYWKELETMIRERADQLVATLRQDTEHAVFDQVLVRFAQEAVPAGSILIVSDGVSVDKLRKIRELKKHAIGFYRIRGANIWVAVKSTETLDFVINKDHVLRTIIDCGLTDVAAHNNPNKNPPTLNDISSAMWGGQEFNLVLTDQDQGILMYDVNSLRSFINNGALVADVKMLYQELYAYYDREVGREGQMPHVILEAICRLWKVKLQKYEWKAAGETDFFPTSSLSAKDMLWNKNPYIRARAVRYVGMLAGAEAIPLLQWFAHDSESIVCQQAEETLRVITPLLPPRSVRGGPEPAIPELITAIAVARIAQKPVMYIVHYVEDYPNSKYASDIPALVGMHEKFSAIIQFVYENPRLFRWDTPVFSRFGWENRIKTLTHDQAEQYPIDDIGSNRVIISGGGVEACLFNFYKCLLTSVQNSGIADNTEFEIHMSMDCVYSGEQGKPGVSIAHPALDLYEKRLQELKLKKGIPYVIFRDGIPADPDINMGIRLFFWSNHQEMTDYLCSHEAQGLTNITCPHGEAIETAI
ncbi:MAG: HEAT repeat domain-containing protein [Candidatus Omnitrophota bacterium]